MEENNQTTDEEKNNPPEPETPDSKDSGAGEEKEAALETSEPPRGPEKPDLDTDLQQLESMNLRQAIIVKMKGGRHPDSKTDELLARHFNFSSDDFQGPYVVRLICTILMIFAVCAILWGVLWLLASGFGLTYFTRLISTGMATLLAAVGGIAIFHPSSIPDENVINHVIEKKLTELRRQVSSQSISEEYSEEEASSDLIDADYDELKNPAQPMTPENLETSLPEDEMIEPSESTIQDEEIDQETTTKNP
jgi:hypothetical protein